MNNKSKRIGNAANETASLSLSVQHADAGEANVKIPKIEGNSKDFVVTFDLWYLYDGNLVTIPDGKLQ